MIFHVFRGIVESDGSLTDAVDGVVGRGACASLACIGFGVGDLGSVDL